MKNHPRNGPRNDFGSGTKWRSEVDNRQGYAIVYVSAQRGGVGWPIRQGYAMIYVSAQIGGVRWPIRQGYAIIYVSAQIGGVRWPLHKDMP